MAFVATHATCLITLMPPMEYIELTPNDKANCKSPHFFHNDMISHRKYIIIKNMEKNHRLNFQSKVEKILGLNNL